MAGQILSGLNSNTFSHLQLGAGVILQNFAYEGVRTASEFKTALQNAVQNGQSLGGTQGGIQIEITPKYREIELDGANMPMKGGQVIDEWTCRMSASLKEFTPDVLRKVFSTGETGQVGAADSGLSSLRLRASLEQGDYADNSAWVASTQYGYVMVALFHTLTATYGALTAADKSEGTIPVRITAHADSSQREYAPCEIWFVDMEGGLIQTAAVGGESV